MCAYASPMASQPAVRRDMNRMRRELAEKNPRGYHCVLRCEVGQGGHVETVRADLVPMYFASPVLREELGELPERPTGREKVVVVGDVPLSAFRIFLAYAEGSANCQNWAADLDASPRDAGFVWELAVTYKVESLERLVRASAFNIHQGLSWSTAPRLLWRARGRDDRSARKAFMYVAYKLGECTQAPDFAILSFSDMRRLMKSKHLRATQEQRFAALCKWLHGVPLPPGKSLSPEEEVKRKSDFYEILPTLLFPLAEPPEDDGDGPEEMEEIGMSAYEYCVHDRLEEWEMAPVAPSRSAPPRRRVAMFAFRLNPPRSETPRGHLGLLGRALERSRTPDAVNVSPAPVFKGVFQAFAYYWQLECTWMDAADEGGAGLNCHLRLMHGTDQAGRNTHFEVLGLQTVFRMFLHCSANLDHVYKSSAVCDVDMLNLPGRRSTYGFSNLLTARDCKMFLKRPPDLHVSIEIRRVNEMTKEFD